MSFEKSIQYSAPIIGNADAKKILNDSVIEINNLSKQYQIYANPRERLKQFVLPRLQRFARNKPRQYYEEFCAVNNVSLDVKKGETIGIIGRNGSGKSTLLQMICGTLTPTHGNINTSGRIAALLELGSGFNPEFTGRENVYLNASIIGLTKEETDTRINDILGFAEIGNFIEQPVKTYSSGMLVRLAFSVIAHVDADILVIDEALAVGDAIFTQKCMRYLRRFMEKGTVLFVSHDIGSVNNLCKKAIWLDEGAVKLYGSAKEVTQAYSEFCAQESYGNNTKLTRLKKEKVEKVKAETRTDSDTRITFYEDIANSDGWITGGAEILDVSFSTPEGEPITTFVGGEKVTLRVRAIIHSELSSPIIGFFVKDRLGQPLFGEHTYTYVQPPIPAASGEILDAEFIFSLPLLPNGDYSMTVSIADGDPSNHVQHHWLHDAVLIKVFSPKLRYGLVGIEFESVKVNKGIQR